MSAQIIILDDERRRRAARAAPVDFLVLAAVCFWPIALTWFAAQAALDALTAAASGSTP